MYLYNPNFWYLIEQLWCMMLYKVLNQKNTKRSGHVMHCNQMSHPTHAKRTH